MNTQQSRKHGELPEVEETDTVQTEYSPEHSDAPTDVASDPALDDRLGSDWSDEGGATSAGPATSTPETG